MIDVEQLVKHYGDFPAVQGVQFSVQPGEVVGLLGPNGAGKSTTLRILTGYLPPTSGRVRVADKNIQEEPLEARAQVGYLSETNPLYESLGIWEYLHIIGQLRGLSGSHLQERIDYVVDLCSLSSVISKDVGQLSKGYRQRLGLAMAILHDPAILILDEPTSALDPNQQKDVRDLILTLKEKKTVLLSTHILPEAEEICDRLLIIHQGRIVAQGTVDEIKGQAAGEKPYFVRLQGPRDELQPALESLPSITRVSFQDEKEKGCPAFEIAGTEDPRRALFGLAKAKDWPLLELTPRHASLNEIFYSLTEKNQ